MLERKALAAVRSSARDTCLVCGGRERPAIHGAVLRHDCASWGGRIHVRACSLERRRLWTRRRHPPAVVPNRAPDKSALQVGTVGSEVGTAKKRIGPARPYDAAVATRAVGADRKGWSGACARCGRAPRTPSGPGRSCAGGHRGSATNCARSRWSSRAT